MFATHEKEEYVLYNWAVVPLNFCTITVEGYRSDVPGKRLWRSTEITTRLSSRILVSSSGHSYCLKGHINCQRSVQKGFSTYLIEKFQRGFPKNWKELFLHWQSIVFSNGNLLNSSCFTAPCLDNTEELSLPKSSKGRPLLPPFPFWSHNYRLGECLEFSDKSTAQNFIPLQHSKAHFTSSEKSIKSSAERKTDYSISNSSIFSSNNSNINRKNNFSSFYNINPSQTNGPVSKKIAKNYEDEEDSLLKLLNIQNSNLNGTLSVGTKENTLKTTSNCRKSSNKTNQPTDSKCASKSKSQCKVKQTTKKKQNSSSVSITTKQKSSSKKNNAAIKDTVKKTVKSGTKETVKKSNRSEITETSIIRILPKRSCRLKAESLNNTIKNSSHISQSKIEKNITIQSISKNKNASHSLIGSFYFEQKCIINKEQIVEYKRTRSSNSDANLLLKYGIKNCSVSLQRIRCDIKSFAGNKQLDFEKQPWELRSYTKVNCSQKNNGNDAEKTVTHDKKKKANVSRSKKIPSKEDVIQRQSNRNKRLCRRTSFEETAIIKKLENISDKENVISKNKCSSNMSQNTKKNASLNKLPKKVKQSSRRNNTNNKKARKESLKNNSKCLVDDSDPEDSIVSLRKVDNKTEKCKKPSASKKAKNTINSSSKRSGKNLQTKKRKFEESFSFVEVETKKNGSENRKRPVITAGKGTAKRQQQLRELMLYENENYEADLFDSTPYRHKNFGLSPSLLESHETDIDEVNTPRGFNFLTPTSCLPVFIPVSTKKTPSFSWISPSTFFTERSRKEVDTYVCNRRKKGQKAQLNKKPKMRKSILSTMKNVPSISEVNSKLFELANGKSNHSDEEDYYYSDCDSD